MLTTEKNIDLLQSTKQELENLPKILGLDFSNSNNLDIKNYSTKQNISNDNEFLDIKILKTLESINNIMYTATTTSSFSTTDIFKKILVNVYNYKKFISPVYNNRDLLYLRKYIGLFNEKLIKLMETYSCDEEITNIMLSMKVYNRINILKLTNEKGVNETMSILRNLSHKESVFKNAIVEVKKTYNCDEISVCHNSTDLIKTDNGLFEKLEFNDCSYIKSYKLLNGRIPKQDLIKIDDLLILITDKYPKDFKNKEVPYFNTNNFKNEPHVIKNITSDSFIKNIHKDKDKDMNKIVINQDNCIN